MKYLVICEKSPGGWGAYAPDLAGLGAAGATLDEEKNSFGKLWGSTLKACALTATQFRRPAPPPNTSRYRPHA
jgi:predicted RNase H-like HicB family nuclease